MSKERIVRYSAEEIEQMAASGKGLIDRARVDAMSDEEIERSMRDDPDWADFIDVDWSTADIVQPLIKKPLSIRLDQEVVDFFQKKGRGYQTRINAVLRHYVEQQKALSEQRKK